ncbi:hypothetical protein BLNAU_24125 [Blattamonas nauphoetae]|uniref:Uncharacterized protein n=1 Tax=Blattamonas nauphoetae TaxID=2049346 RepID=A0ABQ9WNC3_9EUKA|nr:hypothetical protein BLNAU_24125 [Blattamonas nauphoetae]
MEQLIPQLITAVQLRAHIPKRNGESTAGREGMTKPTRRCSDVPFGRLNDHTISRSFGLCMRSIAFQTFQNFITPTLLQTSSLLDSTITAQTKTRKLHRADGENLEQNNIAPKGIDGRLIVIKNGKKEFEGEYIPFIPGEVRFNEGEEHHVFIPPSYIETADAFGGFGGLTDQMMDNEEPEKRLVLIHNGKKMLKRRDKDPKRSLGEEEDDPSYVETKGPGGQTILRGLIGQTVNEEEEQERKEMEELEAQIAAEEERMQEEEAAALVLAASTKKKRKIEPERTRSSVSLRPASKKAKKKGDHDDDADANRMKMAMGGHENRKLTRKGQPDDKKKEEEEERLAREETERLAKLEADRLAKEEAERLAKEEEERLRKEAVESERKRR